MTTDLGPIEGLRDYLETHAQIEGHDVTLPKVHPDTGEVLTRGGMTWDRNVQVMHYGPPRAPTRTVEEWDDDCEVLLSTRELTDVEFNAAKRDHRKAMTEYRRTGGKLRVPGAPRDHRAVRV